MLSENNKIASDIRISLEGFEGFYTKEIQLQNKFNEMGECYSCTTLDDDEIIKMSLSIKLSDLYLLNTKTLGQMKRFVIVNDEDFLTFSLDCDSILTTIYHEIAHAVQNAKNIDCGIREYDQEQPTKLCLVFSDCPSTNRYPKLVREHELIDKLAKQLFENSEVVAEFKIF